jgi:hypothetical protein
MEKPFILPHHVTNFKMKKYIVFIALFMFAFVLSKGSVTQSSVKRSQILNKTIVQNPDTVKLSDTLKFIRDSIIAHKERFEHQPLGKILDMLPFKVKSYSFGFGHKIGTIQRLSLFFEPSVIISNKLESRKHIVSLSFYFEKPLDALIPEQIELKSQGEWLDAEQKYYRNQIIRDIRY